MVFTLKGSIHFLKKMCIYSTHLYLSNPGWNITAMLTLGGFGIMVFSMLLSQFGVGTPDPVLIEMGKAAFFSGMGRASQQAEGDNHEG